MCTLTHKVRFNLLRFALNDDTLFYANLFDGQATEKEKILKRKERFTGAGDATSADAEVC